MIILTHDLQLAMENSLKPKYNLALLSLIDIQMRMAFGCVLVVHELRTSPRVIYVKHNPVLLIIHIAQLNFLNALFEHTHHDNHNGERKI